MQRQAQLQGVMCMWIAPGSKEGGREGRERALVAPVCAFRTVRLLEFIDFSTVLPALQTSESFGQGLQAQLCRSENTAGLRGDAGLAGLSQKLLALPEAHLGTGSDRRTLGCGKG